MYSSIAKADNIVYQSLFDTKGNVLKEQTTTHISVYWLFTHLADLHYYKWITSRD